MRLLIFDTETSGLVQTRLVPLKKQPSIIEFYGCVVDLATGEVFRELDLLIKPSEPISAEITKITKIDNDMLEDASPFSAVSSSIQTFIESAPAVCAHNLTFDMDMVDFEFERLGQTVTWPKRKICSAEATVHLLGYRLKLQGLYELLFEETLPEAHRARNDVAALTRCMVELFKRGEI